MKRIAVFCDGTWSGTEQPDPTNVRRMALLVPPRGPDGIVQRTLYFQGVGVPEGGSWLERLDERISGGAMGIGLDKKIAIAFEHLGKQYDPGDEVYIFGFSRGAYTARSLAGLIRNCGLPIRPSPDLVTECFERYRDRSDETRPDSAASMAFRLRVSPWIVTSAEEAQWRAEHGHPAGHPFEVTYMGVWDTVGALGIPSHWGLPARILNRKYRFHDTDLSRMVRSARHAVAVDERRRPFVPTLWTNLADLKATNPSGDYRQEWFAGGHGSVGGGGDIVSLSGLALIWIASGAMREGLGLDRTELARIGADCQPLGPLYNRRAGRSLPERILELTGKWREGPEDIAMVSHPAIARWLVRDEAFPPDWAGRPYRPKTLGRLGDRIDGFDLAAITDYSAILMV